MLRTIAIRNEVLRSGLKRVFNTNVVRCLTSHYSRRQNLHRDPVIKHKHYEFTWQTGQLRHYSSEFPAHSKINLPALSPTMEFGSIISWEKKEGDKLNEGDLLCEIETDKATMGFETPEEGYLAKIIIQAGEKNVPIGRLLCIIVENQADVAAFKDFKPDSATSSPTPTPSAAVSPPPPTTTAAAVSPPSFPTPSASPPPPPGAEPGSRLYASPMARRLAEAQRIRLEVRLARQGIRMESPGSGIYGSITSADLSKATPAPSAAPIPFSVPAPAPGQAYVDIPLTSMRATIAKRLLLSKQTIPHFQLTVDINVDKLLATRSRFNKELDKEGVKLSVNDFIIKAVSLASKRVPAANSAWMDTFIRQFSSVDVSVAVATDKGLITPIVFGAEGRGLVEISKTVKALAAKAREGKLQPQEFQGGTISISNLGMFGITHFNAIINPPQSCILAIGGTQERIVPDTTEQGWKHSKYISVTLSCDHRVVDGAVGAQWLIEFRKFLEDPSNMLL